MKESLLYRVLKVLADFINFIFITPKYIGRENIPKKGKIILAGTHTSETDPILLASATSRPIHFLVKDELWKGPKKIIFNNLGLIPVNRREKDHNALPLAKKYLDDDKLVLIFPEGTTEKGKGLLNFKIGAIKLAHDTDTKIVPFVIMGKYHLFSKKLKVIFGKPFKVISDDLEKENIKFMDMIKKMIEVNTNVNI